MIEQERPDKFLRHDTVAATLFDRSPIAGWPSWYHASQGESRESIIRSERRGLWYVYLLWGPWASVTWDMTLATCYRGGKGSWRRRLRRRYSGPASKASFSH